MFKDFTKDFDFLLKKLKNNENFAFSRFSDGELFIMQNKTVILAENHYVTGDIRGSNKYTKEEQKKFIPTEHQFYRNKLIECFLHEQDNYYKGICTPSDAHVGKENFDYMLKLHNNKINNLTFSNLLINANYKRFVEEIIPILNERKILYVVNELANTKKLPFEIEKEFIIGSDCMINNYDTSKIVKEYIADNNIQDYIILCSAASLSNFIIYENFKINNNNTFLDIGSCLNPLLDLEGWKYTRGYLTSYWLGHNNHYGEQVDIWP